MPSGSTVKASSGLFRRNEAAGRIESAGMVISTHLPPPVMIESTPTLTLVTHILCCSWDMYFSDAASSENDHGSMNLATNTVPVLATNPSRVAPIQRTMGWRIFDFAQRLPSRH